MLVFPVHLFNPARINAYIERETLQGGTALSGETDVVSSDGGGRWRVEMGPIELLTPDQIRAWRAWVDEWQGGVTAFSLPVPDLRQAPLPLLAGRRLGPAGLRRGTSDDYFPGAHTFRSPAVSATITTNAPLRGTQAGFAIARGSTLRGGEQFSIQHPKKGHRMYRVGRLLPTGEYRITPPFREPVPAGTIANFDWPLLSARLDIGTDVSPGLDNGRSATVNAVFVEAV